MKQTGELVMAHISSTFCRRGLVFSLVFFVCGCSARELYKAGQEHQRQECHDVPASEYDDCMAQADKSYEAYERIKKGGKRAE